MLFAFCSVFFRRSNSLFFFIRYKVYPSPDDDIVFSLRSLTPDSSSQKRDDFHSLPLFPVKSSPPLLVFSYPLLAPNPLRYGHGTFLPPCFSTYALQLFDSLIHILSFVKISFPLLWGCSRIARYCETHAERRLTFSRSTSFP